MRLALVMTLQASIGPSPDGVPTCEASALEIVVCGKARDPDRYRLKPMEPMASSAPPRAEWELGGGVRAGVAASQVPMPQGAVSNRVMVTVKLPF